MFTEKDTLSLPERAVLFTGMEDENCVTLMQLKRRSLQRIDKSKITITWYRLYFSECSQWKLRNCTFNQNYWETRQVWRNTVSLGKLLILYWCLRKRINVHKSVYRPVTLTSIVGKRLTSIVGKYIQKHLDKCSRIWGPKHGLTRGRPGLTILLLIYEKVYENYDTVELDLSPWRV